MEELTMSTAALPRIVSVQSDPLDGELQDGLGHIRDLVFIRDLLRQRGECSTELQEYDAVINEARAQLAESAKRASARYANASLRLRL
jgi:CHAD domain-containing protein